MTIGRRFKAFTAPDGSGWTTRRSFGKESIMSIPHRKEFDVQAEVFGEELVNFIMSREGTFHSNVIVLVLLDVMSLMLERAVQRSPSGLAGVLETAEANHAILQKNLIAAAGDSARH
jgi:hypothetical protein